ncbi:MAG: cytochrome c [Sphingomonadales bacterium]|nr:cytochrome c [Sphingomonadales bacterium]
MGNARFLLNFTLGAAVGVLAAAAASAQTAGEAQTAAAMSAQTVKPGDADGAFVTGGKFSEPDGDKMYRRVCAGCHMPDAKGSVAAGFYPALAGNPKLAAGAYPVMIVLKGLHGMPPVGAMMTDAQVADVVNHVRSHFGNHYRDKVTAADVKALR